MYTLYALRDISGFEDHIGFMFICVFSLLLWIGALGCIIDTFERKSAYVSMSIITVVFVIIVSFGAYKSYSGVDDEGVHYKNEPVVATKVKEFEGSSTDRQGKRNVDVPSMHVTYQLPDGNTVNFRMSDGKVYPDQVTLYKN